MRKFAISYHSLLKRVIRLSKYESTSATCGFNRVPSCAEVLRNLMYRFMTRVDVCSNAIVAAICASDLMYNSLIRRSWIERLYVRHDAVT